MKRKGLRALLLSLLCVLFLPAAAQAASPLEKVNHTDSADYCMRAHDVTLALSEMQSLDDSALDAEIERASAYAFLTRSSGLTTALTEGYRTDFSGVERKLSSAGYPVTVTLPEVTSGVVSAVTYRVFVTADAAALPDGHEPQKGYAAHADTKSACISYDPEVTITESQRESWLGKGEWNASFLALFSFSARDRITGDAADVQPSAEIGGLDAAPSAFPAEYAVKVTFAAAGGETAAAACRLKVTEDPKPVSYRLTVRYADGSGKELRAPFQTSLEAGQKYDVTAKAQERINGYAFSGTDVPAAGVISGDLTITASYKKLAPAPSEDSDDEYYCVSVRYVDQETGRELADCYRSGSIREGRGYDVIKQTAVDVKGYTVSSVEGKTSGKITDDVVITVYYQKAVAVVPEEPPTVPESPQPAVPEGPPAPVPEAPLPAEPAAPAADPETPPPAPAVTEKEQAKAPAAEDAAPKEEKSPAPAKAPAAESVPAAAPHTNAEPDGGAAVGGGKPEGAPAAAVGSTERILPPREAPVELNTRMSGGQDIGPVILKADKGGTSALEMILIGLGAVSAAALGGGIASDLRVLKWYDAKKRKAAGV